MKLQDLFPGSFRAEHFAAGPQTFTIKAIVPILFEESGEHQQKGKMSFEEISSYWIFGKEAAGELAAEIEDDDTDHWIGRRIELRQDRTRYKGEMVPCIRGHFAEAPSRAVASIASGNIRPEDIAALERALEQAKAKASAPAKVPA